MAKFLTLGFGLLVAVSAWADGGTAYLALKAAQKGADSSANLVEVTGERGEPQPQEWKVIFNDPAARGGVREIVASGDVIVSQRTPLKGYGAGSGPSIALKRLNLDSDRAFEITNKQAIARRISFNWVDYTLRANAAGGSPMWILRLYNNMGSQVGVIQISAENGSVLSPLVANSQPPPVETTGQHDDSPSGDNVGGLIGRVGGTLGGVANTVKDSTLRTVGTVQEFLTGERTIGPKDEDEQ